MLNVTASSVPPMFQEARAHHSFGRLQEAEKLYRQILMIEPNHAGALDLLGTIALQCRQYEPAIGLLRKSVAIDPKSHEALNHLAAALAAVHQLPEAEEMCRKSLALKPQQPRIISALAATLLYQNKLEEAVETFKKALVLNPNIAEAFHGLACAQRDLGNFPAAIHSCRCAIELNPGEHEPHVLLVQLLIKNNQLDEARKALAAALERHPKSEELRFNKAALDGDASVTAPPVNYVAGMFQNNAARFDDLLVGRLQYKGPQLLLEAVQAVAPNRTFDILDLGCGTGLCGPLFKPVAKSLAGVDLAPNMIALAGRRKVYDRLEVGDLIGTLHKSPGGHDLLLAADVFVYIGDLAATFAAAAAALRPGGLLAFSIEATEHAPYQLQQTLRFAHTIEYIRELAGKNQLAERYARQHPLRLESTTPVSAWIVVLEKSA